MLKRGFHVLKIMQIRVCKRCGKPFFIEMTSKRKYCIECHALITREAGVQMKQKKGPHFERWKMRMLEIIEEAEKKRLLQPGAEEPKLGLETRKPLLKTMISRFKRLRRSLSSE